MHERVDGKKGIASRGEQSTVRLELRGELRLPTLICNCASIGSHPRYTRACGARRYEVFGIERASHARSDAYGAWIRSTRTVRRSPGAETRERNSEASQRQREKIKASRRRGHRCSLKTGRV